MPLKSRIQKRPYFYLSGRIFPLDWPESFAKSWQHCSLQCFDKKNCSGDPNYQKIPEVHLANALPEFSLRSLWAMCELFFLTIRSSLYTHFLSLRKSKITHRFWAFAQFIRAMCPALQNKTHIKYQTVLTSIMLPFGISACAATGL